MKEVLVGERYAIKNGFKKTSHGDFSILETFVRSSRFSVPNPNDSRWLGKEREREKGSKRINFPYTTPRSEREFFWNHRLNEKLHHMKFLGNSYIIKYWEPKFYCWDVVPIETRIGSEWEFVCFRLRDDLMNIFFSCIRLQEWSTTANCTMEYK